ncbi:MAG: M15 family metallopeptidase, partial [Paracoccaceae bacterium]
EQVGPVRVRLLKPAIDSLRQVFDTIQKVDPDLYARIKTAGSLCVRFIRGSTTSASTHAYGLALDLNIDGVLDTLGDGKTQLGLTILADFFRAEGWVWGAAWGREDSMHFEVSRNKLEEWIAQGML